MWILLLLFRITSYNVCYTKLLRHPDEHFQILEFANLKTGLNNPEDLAWEFNDRIRPSIQPILAYLVIEGCDAVGISNPFSQTTVLRIISSVMGFMVMLLLIHTFKDELETEKLRKWFIYLSIFLSFVITSYSIHYTKLYEY